MTVYVVSDNSGAIHCVYTTKLAAELRIQMEEGLVLRSIELQD